MRRVQLYDTRTREARLFVPLTPPKVGLFVCGLTPYANAHVGHAKTAVTFDVLARALTHWGYRVFYVQNVTNIDDRLIVRGGQEGVDPLVLADRHFLAWRLAMARLGVRSVNYYPHATDYIPEILTQIQQLIDRGLAYASRGSVYFDVAKFPAYGELSGQRTESLRPGARVEIDADKRAPEDFVLWKAATPGEPTWESPWGPGRPGWHIEDTAITVRLFGPRYDIHGGGLDLKFPHHEAEIAQAEGATGERPLVNFWMHAGLVTLRGEKMSKSLGNVVGLDDALERHGPMALRLFYLNAHYRSPLDFVDGKSLEESASAYATLRKPWDRLRAAIAIAAERDGSAPLPPELETAAERTLHALDEALADDFNTREAIAQLFGWGTTLADALAAASTYSASDLEVLAGPYRWAGEVLGLFEEPAGETVRGELAPLVELALDARRRARERGDFQEADRLRDALSRAGIRVEDSGATTRWEFRGAPA